MLHNRRVLQVDDAIHIVLKVNRFIVFHNFYSLANFFFSSLLLSKETILVDKGVYRQYESSYQETHNP